MPRSQLQDVIYLGPGVPSPAAPPELQKHPTLIFFITGNPGLIEYYRAFLKYLSELLPQRKALDSEREYHVYGASLAGFDVASNPDTPAVKVHDGRGPPYGLSEQVDRVVLRLTGAVRDTAQLREGKKVLVILIGHSVGAYILLEILSRFQNMQVDSQTETPFDISGGICLFPTVVDIAKSPTGEKLTPLLTAPYFADLVHHIARPLAYLPLVLVFWLVQLITRLPDEAALVTTAFLRSRHGVRQALHMAGDEMREIKHDRFSDELWGTPASAAAAVSTDSAKTIHDKTAAATSPSSTASSTRHRKARTYQQERTRTPRLFFLFGENDHWVANSTRDTLISTRGRILNPSSSACPESSHPCQQEESKPVMEVDDNGIPHGFCTRDDYSRIIAVRVAYWVREMEGGT